MFIDGAINETDVEIALDPAESCVIHHSLTSCRLRGSCSRFSPRSLCHGFNTFFEIYRSVPRRTADLVGNDVVRVAEKIGVVPPFYGALGYTPGALAQGHGVLDKLRPSPVQEPEAESGKVKETVE